jgi:pilus assembly protein CpaF
MEGDLIAMQEIYRFERQGVDPDGKIIGQHRATGIRPHFTRRAEELSLPIPADLFRQS